MEWGRIAVFASGTGSNFAALVQAQREGRLGGGSIELLVSDKPEAPVAQRAEEAGIPALLLRPKDFEGREQYEAAIVAELQRRNIGLVVLAGYMRLISLFCLHRMPDGSSTFILRCCRRLPGRTRSGRRWSTA